jgi:hypothetical protein
MNDFGQTQGSPASLMNPAVAVFKQDFHHLRWAVFGYWILFFVFTVLQTRSPMAWKEPAFELVCMAFFLAVMAVGLTVAACHSGWLRGELNHWLHGPPGWQARLFGKMLFVLLILIGPHLLHNFVVTCRINGNPLPFLGDILTASVVTFLIVIVPAIFASVISTGFLVGIGVSFGFWILECIALTVFMLMENPGLKDPRLNSVGWALNADEFLFAYVAARLVLIGVTLVCARFQRIRGRFLFATVATVAILRLAWFRPWGEWILESRLSDQPNIAFSAHPIEGTGNRHYYVSTLPVEIRTVAQPERTFLRSRFIGHLTYGTWKIPVEGAMEIDPPESGRGENLLRVELSNEDIDRLVGKKVKISGRLITKVFHEVASPISRTGELAAEVAEWRCPPLPPRDAAKFQFVSVTCWRSWNKGTDLLAGNARFRPTSGSAIAPWLLARQVSSFYQAYSSENETAPQTIHFHIKSTLTATDLHFELVVPFIESSYR